MTLAKIKPGNFLNNFIDVVIREKSSQCLFSRYERMTQFYSHYSSLKTDFIQSIQTSNYQIHFENIELLWTVAVEDFVDMMYYIRAVPTTDYT